MSISEIKNNLNVLHNKSKKDLVRDIHELLIHIKRLDNKIVGLNTESRYLNRHMIKVRNLIDKVLKIKIKENDVWEKK